MYISQDPVVVIELVRGGRPIRPTQAHNNSRRNLNFQTIPDSLWLLCQGCWAFPPEHRLNIDQIVESIRNHQHGVRLDEGRSRLGGNLLTLPAPEPPTPSEGVNLNALIPVLQTAEVEVNPLKLIDGRSVRGAIEPAPSSQGVPRIEYISHTTESMASASPRGVAQSIATSMPHSKAPSAAPSRSQYHRSLKVPSKAPSAYTAGTAARVALPTDDGKYSEKATTISGTGKTGRSGPSGMSRYDWGEEGSEGYEDEPAKTERGTAVTGVAKSRTSGRSGPSGVSRYDWEGEEGYEPTSVSQSPEKKAASRTARTVSHHPDARSGAPSESAFHEVLEDNLEFDRDNGTVRIQSTVGHEEYNMGYDPPPTIDGTVRKAPSTAPRYALLLSICILKPNVTPLLLDYSASHRSYRTSRSKITARGVPLPSSVSPVSEESEDTVREGAFWTATPRVPQAVYVGSPRSSSSIGHGIVAHQPVEVRSGSSSGTYSRAASPAGRPMQFDQHSVAPSHTSTLKTARSPRHPDLAQATQGTNQMPYNAHTPSLMELANPSTGNVVGNRLSTIPDEGDLEQAEGEAQQQTAGPEYEWDEGADDDWAFLRAVEEHRRQRQGEEQDQDQPAAKQSTLASSGAPNEFPPAPQIVFPEDHDLLEADKDLPPLPAPSSRGSQHWATKLEGEQDLQTPSSSRPSGHQKSDSIVSAVNLKSLHIDTNVHPRLTNPNTPRNRPLPMSVGAKSRSSTTTTGSSTSKPARSSRHSKQSSDVTARGSIARERYQQHNNPGEGEERLARSKLGGYRTNSQVSDTEQVALNKVANAVCPVCGRMYATRAILKLHSESSHASS